LDMLFIRWCHVNFFYIFLIRINLNLKLIRSHVSHKADSKIINMIPSN
jgi:hypothetical protein